MNQSEDAIAFLLVLHTLGMALHFFAALAEAVGWIQEIAHGVFDGVRHIGPLDVGFQVVEDAVQGIDDRNKCPALQMVARHKIWRLQNFALTDVPMVFVINQKLLLALRIANQPMLHRVCDLQLLAVQFAFDERVFRTKIMNPLFLLLIASDQCWDFGRYFAAAKGTGTIPFLLCLCSRVKIFFILLAHARAIPALLNVINFFLSISVPSANEQVTTSCQQDVFSFCFYFNTNAHKNELYKRLQQLFAVNFATVVQWQF